MTLESVTKRDGGADGGIPAVSYTRGKISTRFRRPSAPNLSPSTPSPPAAATGRPPRRRRKAERTPEIVAAAIASFAEHGYADTRLEDVAERAGIAKSTIYLYFANKEAVFRAAVETRVQATFGELDEVVTGFEGTTEELLGVVLASSYERFVRSDTPTLLRTIISEGERFPELRRVFYEESLCRGTQVLERLLRRGVARGEFREAPVIDFPRMLIAPTLMASIWRMTFDELDPIDIDAWARAHVDLLMNGLRR